MAIVSIIAVIYYCCINVYAYSLMKSDKQQAKQHRRRVPERKLFWLCYLGGAIGIWLGMRNFRHKTKHASFIFGVPTLLILHIGTIYTVVQVYDYYVN